MPGLALLTALVVGSGAALAAGPDGLAGADVYQRCGEKYAGEDQQGKFTVTLRDREGRIRRSEYIRLWKDYHGVDDIADKMLLFTIYPPDARGAAFMRIAYTPESGKPVDQWIYLPLLKKVRRVTIRDPGDSFLNSNLTYADVSARALDADDYRYLGVSIVDDLEFYVVESIPKESNPLYGKRVFWFTKEESWDDCVTARIDYYDSSGELVKDQFIKWQRIGDAWVWERVLVRSRLNESASIFQLSDMKVNTGLDDDLFSARSLQRGPEVIERFQREP
jgi:outer membrane lipoprotein-sorting protein